MAYQTSSEHELSTELFERIGNAVSVVHVGERVGNHVEHRGRCHQNVARWLEQHPLDGPARGWLVDRSQQQNGFVEFHAHSVVATACGALMDITLGKADPDYPFLLDGRSDGEFLILARRHPTLRHVVDQARYGAFQLAVEHALLYGDFDTPD